jgi:hypothetical protein
VKRESHQKYGVITKRQRMVYDGNNQDDPEFAKEVAGSLGAFSTDQSMVCGQFGRTTVTEVPIGRALANSNTCHGTDYKGQDESRLRANQSS